MTKPTQSNAPDSAHPLSPWLRNELRSNRDLALHASLEEPRVQGIAKTTVLLAGAVIVGFISWSSMAELRESATAPGEIVTSGTLRAIQHLEGGIIETLLVKEGELVEVGQPLARINAVHSRSERDRVLARRAALRLSIERLRAGLEGRQPDFDAVVPSITAAQLATSQASGTTPSQSREISPKGVDSAKHDEMALFRSQREQRERELAILQAQLRQRELERDVGLHQVQTVKRQIELLEEKLKMHQQLTRAGYGAKLDLLSAKGERVLAKGELDRLTGSTAAMKAAIDEYRQRILEMENRWRNDSLSALNERAAELAELEKTLASLDDRVVRSEITAPIGGIVQHLPFKAEGAVVPPGGLIAELLPVNDELVVESRISTSDIGFIHPGQQAQVKVQTYNFARYGTVDGTVESLSPTTFVDDTGSPYYKARITLAHSHLGVDGTYPLLPGMTVQADITTGTKTLMQYMLKPIYTTLNEGFHER